MNFYLLEPDRRIPGIAAVGDVPENLEPLDWLRGKRMPNPGPLRLPLSASSGDLRPDLIGTLLTLFSDDLKNALLAFGIDNVDYVPVQLQHPRSQELESGYWLSNVIGLVECVDLSRSVIEPRPSGTKGSLLSFHVDPDRAAGLHLFRLVEDPTLIVIDEPLRRFLQAQDLAGVRLRHTRTYDGF